MPPGEERLGDLQVISQPPLSTPTSQPMEHPDENEVYIRGRSLSEGTVLQGLASFPWNLCPPPPPPPQVAVLWVKCSPAVMARWQPGPGAILPSAQPETHILRWPE